MNDAQWAPPVRLASLLLGDTERADEIAQDAIVATFQRRNRLGDGVPVGYLRQCVVNACRSAHATGRCSVARSSRCSSNGDRARPAR